MAGETDRRPDDMAACLLEMAGEETEWVGPALHAGPRTPGSSARNFCSTRAMPPAGARGVSWRPPACAEPELGTSLDRARTIAAEHGSALLEIDLAGERPRVSVLQDNIAPLRARALARTQEVAL